MHYLSVYCRFRDEAKWLKEWLEYHISVGVEHFFLIDHLSCDNPLSVLRPYIEKGLVTYTHYAEELPAPGTHKHRHIEPFLRMNKIGIAWGKKNSKWLAVMDSDEYLVPVKEEESIASLLKRYEDYPALAVNWQMFGTNAIQEIPEGRLLCETLTRRAPRNYHSNKHVKLIVQPLLTMRVGIHTGHFKDKRNAVDTSYNEVIGNFNESIPSDVLRLHHYFLRDRKYMNEIKVPRRISFSNDPEELWHWDWDMSQEEDRIMSRYILSLRWKVFGSPHPPSTPLPSLHWPSPKLYQSLYPSLPFSSPAEAHRHWFVYGMRERRKLPKLTEEESKEWWEEGCRQEVKEEEPRYVTLHITPFVEEE